MHKVAINNNEYCEIEEHLIMSVGLEIDAPIAHVICAVPNLGYSRMGHLGSAEGVY